MERLEDRIVEHPLRAALDSLSDALDAVSPEVVNAVREAGRGDLIERAASVVDHLEGLIGAAEPQLVSQATLDSLHAPIGRAAQAAADLTSDPAGQSANLDQALEEALQNAAPLAAAAAAFTHSTRRIGQESGSFTRKLKKLEGDAEMIGEELLALESRRQTGLDELSTAEDEKRNELGVRVQELANSVTELQEKADGLVEQHEQKFDAAETDRGQAFDRLVAGIKDRGDAAVERAESIAGNVEDLYGVVTDSATAGEFTKEASGERGSADRWRRVAIGFGIAAAVVAIAAAAISTVTEASTGAIAAKIAATAALAVIATYAARQSAHHRDRGNEIKDLALELVTFEGALHGLDEPEQRELRKQFIERAFRGRAGRQSAEESEQAIEAFGLTPEVLSVLGALLKAAQGQPR